MEIKFKKDLKIMIRQFVKTKKRSTTTVTNPWKYFYFYVGTQSENVITNKVKAHTNISLILSS